MKDQYVILTGSKNNAGDYLIKYRAKKLFEKFRIDRKIIDIDAWIPFTKEVLEEINNSRALILMGGPSLQNHMHPKIYPLTANLDDIKVPIVTMGIGWKHTRGNWSDTYEYALSDETIKLLKRIDNSGYFSSVRDYHTLNSLKLKGFKSFQMTGCPAYYDLDYMETVPSIEKIEKVAFSLGVSFIDSPSMEKQMKSLILELKKKFYDKQFEVVFHHSLDREKFLKTHNSTNIHNQKHNEFADWLKKNNIEYADISGSAENLIDYYKGVDLHIGYRVHAHIFMNSISKFSVLLSEDGRAKGVKGTIGGIVIDGYNDFKTGFISKVLNKLLPNYDRYIANEYIVKELIEEIDYEQIISFNRLKISRKIIDTNLQIMKTFIKQLP